MLTFKSHFDVQQLYLFEIQCLIFKKPIKYLASESSIFEKKMITTITFGD